MRGVALVLIVVLAASVFVVIENSKVPSNIGIHSGKLSELKKSNNGVSSQTNQALKQIEALVFYGDISKTKSTLIEAFNECGTYEININAENYMHIIFASDTMKFKDDLEILIDVDNNVVEYRSESRVGYSDMGVNLERYNKISEYYMRILGDFDK